MPQDKAFNFYEMQYQTTFLLWEHTGSNRGPSACKADNDIFFSYETLIQCGLCIFYDSVFCLFLKYLVTL